MLDLNPLKTEVNVDFETLKKLCSPIHIALILIQGENRSLVATKNIGKSSLKQNGDGCCVTGTGRWRQKCTRRIQRIN